MFRLDKQHALVQTLDFFTPVVDDPFVYGAIAAANSLSDVYAMGGRPLTALAIVCFPEKGVELDLLAKIMQGGLEKLREADVALLGGHTVSDPEIKFGYSVTGVVHPSHILRNAGARPGDALVLTKPLGVGLLTTGIKFKKTSRAAADETIRVMSTLNRTASEIARRYDAHAVTDITGFGLLGHAYEMAEASGVAIRFNSKKIPFIPEAYDIAKIRLLPKAIASTLKMIEARTRIAPGVPDPLRSILLDPQTSGGLLISLNKKDLGSMMADMAQSRVEAAHVGTVEESSELRILVD